MRAFLVACSQACLSPARAPVSAAVGFFISLRIPNMTRAARPGWYELLVGVGLMGFKFVLVPLLIVRIFKSLL